MKALILSDLHDDFWADQGRDPFARCEDLLDGLEAIVLAGDVSNKPKVRWKYAFERLRRRFGDLPIHVFPGNHDFYDWRLDDEDRLAEFAAAWDVHYAQQSVLQLGTTRLICATLWTDLNLGQGREWNETFLPTRMNDYRYIRLAAGGYRRARPDDTRKVHLRHRAFIERTLLEPHPGATWVCTHHAPHPDVLMTYPEQVDAAYASDLSSLLESAPAPDRWLFGHCHDARPLTIGACRLDCISLGYPMDIESDAEIRERIGRAIFEM